MHFTRQQIWQTALNELQEQRKPVTPKSLAERAAKLANDLVYEIIHHNAQCYFQRHGLNLLQIDHLITAELYAIGSPLGAVAWYGDQTTWRQHNPEEHAWLIAEHLAILLWNRGLTRNRHHYLFNFTAEEAKTYCPAQQLVLF